MLMIVTPVPTFRLQSVARVVREAGHVAWWNAAIAGLRGLADEAALSSVNDLDDEAVGLLGRAYQANC